MTSGVLDGVLAALPLPLVLVGPQERIVFANDRATAVFSKPLNSQHYISVLRQPMLLDAIESAFVSGKPQEAVYLGREGARETTYLARAVPVSLEAGTAVLVSFEDQTAMQDAGNMRRDFVANVSHELRTPLTALLGFIETTARPRPRRRRGARPVPRDHAGRMRADEPAGRRSAVAVAGRKQRAAATDRPGRRGRICCALP